MSHPDAEHYLGQELGAPNLTVRVGVSDDIDVEAHGTANVQSNHGFVGLGPTELQTWNLSVDLSATSGSVTSAFAAVPTSNSVGTHGATGRLGAGSGRLRAYAVSGSVSLLASPASDRDDEPAGEGGLAA